MPDIEPTIAPPTPTPTPPSPAGDTALVATPVPVKEVLANPFSSPGTTSSPVLEKLPKRHYRSIFIRILTTFFLLSVAPILLAGALTATVYQSSIREWLPTTTTLRVEQVLLAQNVLLLLLVVIMVVFAGSLISTSLARPLKRLLELTHLVGQGKLEYRLRVTTNDEIGELTEAFNIMVAKLREQQTRERVVSQMKSEFISIAAHQLRTPLSAVKWTIKMLVDGDMGKITDEQKEFLERGYQVNERMIALVGDLLNVARIEEGRFGYRFALIDFTDYLKQFCDRYQYQAQAHGMTLIFEPPTSPLPQISVDTSRIDLALQNLLDNAMKYSRPGGKIVVALKLTSKYVEVSIQDSGVGVPKHQLHRLFTKFFRGDNVVRMQTEGSGLGLFIVKNIIQNHGGEIRVDSEENKGTTMTFTLPLKKDQIPQKEVTFEEFIGGL